MTVGEARAHYTFFAVFSTAWVIGVGVAIYRTPAADDEMWLILAAGLATLAYGIRGFRIAWFRPDEVKRRGWQTDDGA